MFEIGAGMCLKPGPEGGETATPKVSHLLRGALGEVMLASVEKPSQRHEGFIVPVWVLTSRVEEPAHLAADDVNRRGGDLV
ncbi:hypothetical protein ABZ079_16180 [Streptomyces sp. NPDC006314]|uniref:hypothetical protein n=1 Tax=Streptomyces sp. NPDC006314 TaxID=3154475 RepID=UPI0033A75A40